MGRRGKDILRNIAVVYKLDPLLCSSSDASIIRKLYLALELSSNVTLCRLGDMKSWLMSGVHIH